MSRSSSEVADWSATEMLSAYQRRELSPVEATEAVLDRIESADGPVNAFCLLDRERTMADARAAEERWSEGRTLGPVDGVPTSIKDIFLTKGWPT
ncbi:MAG: amidase family protein, partial [Nocardioidaceae bacterium]